MKPRRTQLPVPAATRKSSVAAAPKVPEQAAGYMELRGAVKDASCALVQVDGGVSRERGCCDLYEPRGEDVDEFRCGECEYVRQKSR